MSYDTVGCELETFFGIVVQISRTVCFSTISEDIIRIEAVSKSLPNCAIFARKELKIFNKKYNIIFPTSCLPFFFFIFYPPLSGVPLLVE